jgi:hypothetical protein
MSIRIDGTNTTANPGITGGDADTGLQFGTDEIQLVTGGTNRATVESNGNFTIENGNLVLANGSGIDFSATSQLAGVESELLDDYEEGTWTATLKAGTISAPTHTTDPLASAAHNAKYVKIGNKVFFHFYERWNISSFTGSWSGLYIALPFTVSPQGFAPISLSYWSSFFNTSLSAAYQPHGYIDGNNNHIYLTLQAITVGGESPNNNGTIQLSSSAGLMISGVYTTT